jgi:hypothetical protein
MTLQEAVDFKQKTVETRYSSTVVRIATVANIDVI